MIKSNIETIRQSIPPHVKLVCVSKFQPSSSITDAYNAGERLFGENRPQEMAEKAPNLPSDIEWHFIGNLQTNKVKTVAPIATLIHSVSNERLLDEIEKQATKLDKFVDILIELHVANEETKQGFSPSEASNILSANFSEKYPHLRPCGVMGMATFTDNESIIRQEFKTIYQTFQSLKLSLFKEKDYFCEISMGMSSDYQIAIEEGATIVRIGSSIFGHRQYT